VRVDSPFVLALAGTLGIHLLFLVVADAVTVIYAPEPSKPTPRIELVEIEPPPVLAPPPPPPPDRPPSPEVKQPELPQEAPRPRAVRAAVQPDRRPPPPAELPPAAPPDPAPDPGGAPTVSMPDIAPAATGVAVAPGPRNTGRVGRGGTGGGTGTGAGEGSGEAALPPVSIAAIKTRALPRGDYGYIDAGKDYPPEARRLGIEGAIRVRLTVDDRGKVEAAVLLNRLGHGLDELALARARQIEFEPARDTSDRAVRSVVVWTFNMTLPK
jgi:periplasmic protein TonB